MIRFGLLMTALWATPCAAQTKIAYQFNSGWLLIWRANYHPPPLPYELAEENEITVNDRQFTFSNTEAFELAFSNTNAAGNFNLRKRTQKLSVEFKTDPTVEPAYAYDSKGDRTTLDTTSPIGKRLTPLLDELAKANLDLMLSPQGRVLFAKGIQDNIKGMAGATPFAQFLARADNQARTKLTDLLPVFPDRELKVGDTWEEPFSVLITSGISVVKGKKLYKLTKLDGDVATVSATIDFAVDINENHGGAKITGSAKVATSKGSFTFDVKAGRLIGGTLDTTVSFKGEISKRGRESELNYVRKAKQTLTSKKPAE